MFNSLRHIGYLTLAACLHIIILFILIVSYEFSAPIFVFENTSEHDIVSAVVLGDSLKSKIIADQSQPLPVKKEPPKVEKPPAEVAKLESVPQTKDVIALKPPVKKISPEKKADDISKALLADIKKHKNKQKLNVEKQSKKQFEKMLKEHAEKTLRQQVFDEEIKLQAELNRQSQGIVNKYAALIKQAIGNHWVYSAGTNKNLRCKLNIRLAPGGVVLDVQVTKSSGDLALDHSARAAVFNASPLPVPSDTKLFDQFRIFEVDVSPKDMVSAIN